MLSCEFRAQMLEYLYDLLESDERQALMVHLNDCPACQAELVKAKAQQQLLAAAAKMDFPDVRFTAPTAAPISAQPEVILLQRPHRPLRWRRWVAAAAVLLALASGALLAGFQFAGREGWTTPHSLESFGTALALLIALILVDAFETIIQPRRVTRRLRLTRLFLLTTWRLWVGAAHHLPGQAEWESSTPRDRRLGVYGPLALLLLLALRLLVSGLVILGLLALELLLGGDRRDRAPADPQGAA